MPDPPATDFPNLVCPKCGSQVLPGHLSRQDLSSFTEFASGLDCRSCRASLHPENAVLEYLSKCDPDGLCLQPLSIGGHSLHGTKIVEPGTTREEPIVRSVSVTAEVGGEERASTSSFIPYEIGTALLYESEHEEELTTRQLSGETVEPAGGPILLEDGDIVADVVAVSEDGEKSKIGFMTSVRNDTDVDAVIFGYYATLYVPSIETPAWPELLRESVNVIYDGSVRSPYPLAIAAFDNAVSRQLQRSLTAQGKTESEIEDFFQRHRGWKDHVKQGLEEVAGHRLSTHSPALYEDVNDIRNDRVDIVHAGADDELPALTTSEASRDLNKTIEAIVAVYEICQDSE